MRFDPPASQDAVTSDSLASPAACGLLTRRRGQQAFNRMKNCSSTAWLAPVDASRSPEAATDLGLIPRAPALLRGKAVHDDGRARGRERVDHQADDGGSYNRAHCKSAMSDFEQSPFEPRHRTIFVPERTRKGKGGDSAGFPHTAIFVT